MTTTKTAFQKGDYVEVTDTTDPSSGQTFEVLEVDSEDSLVRTNKGWLQNSQVKPSAKSVATTVDGQDATIVLNGKTGAVQEPLIPRSLYDVAGDIARKQGEVDVAASAAGKARKRVKDLKDELTVFIRELCGLTGIPMPKQLELGEEDEED